MEQSLKQIFYVTTRISGQSMRQSAPMVDIPLCGLAFNLLCHNLLLE
jgi:hypothetical protein